MNIEGSLSAKKPKNISITDIFDDLSAIGGRCTQSNIDMHLTCYGHAHGILNYELNELFGSVYVIVVT